MDEMKKDTNLLNGKGEEDNVSWITLNGAHIPIRNGETREAAISRFFSEYKKDKQSKQPEKQKKVPPLEEQVDKVLNGTYKDQHITLSEHTPKSLQMLGIPDYPLLMTTKHAYLTINESGVYTNPKDHYHGLGRELFLMLPKLLENPMCVLQNKQNIKDGDVLVVLNWYDKNKNILIMPIRINGKGKYNYIEVDANIAKSAYGRENFAKYINDHYKMEDMLSFTGNKKIRDFTSKGSAVDLE